MSDRKEAIIYQTPTIVNTGSGGTKEEYEDSFSDYAYVKNMNERMDVVAMQQVEGTIRQFQITKTDIQVQRSWRIKYKGEVHKILTIDDPKKNDKNILKILAKTHEP